ncbi:MAG: hypothetical protein ACRCSF_01155 [Mycobacteriaceae bacterium]
MEPVEVNAGSWYLRALRCDDRVDDTPALQCGGITDNNYIGMRTLQWHNDTHYSWAVCQPTTGELLAEVVIERIADTGLLSGWSRDGQNRALRAGMQAVRRFAEAALGLTIIEKSAPPP